MPYPGPINQYVVDERLIFDDYNLYSEFINPVYRYGVDTSRIVVVASGVHPGLIANDYTSFQIAGISSERGQESRVYIT